MGSGLRQVVSIVGALRAMALRQGRTLAVVAVAAVAAVGAICMSGCAPTITLASGFSEITPGTVPVDTFLVDDTYKAVKIGGITWMAKNMDVENGNSWCFDDDRNNCDLFGRLYDWNTALKICPPGWHLPSKQEWTDLIVMAGGEKAAAVRLKSSKQVVVPESPNAKFTGTDDYGFSAVPNGMRSGTSGEYRITDNNGELSAAWWTSETVKDSTCSNCAGRSSIALLGPKSFYINESSAPRRGGLAVRCILND